MATRCVLGPFLGCLLLAAQLSAQDSQPTTWFIVRHADRADEEDALTEAGLRRADHLRDLMKQLRVSAVYSTDTNRTRRTAEPTANALRLPITTYGPLNDAWFEQIKKNHRGQAVLIVAHSNTAGTIVHGLGGQGDFSMADAEFDNLFIVTTGTRDSSAVRVKYGDAPTPAPDAPPKR